MAITFERRLASTRLAYPPSGLFYSPLTSRARTARDEVVAKVRDGRYPMETVACFCGSSAFRAIAEVDRYGLPVQTTVCLKCGLLGTNPRMSQDSYARFYNCEYRTLYGSEEKPPEEAFAHSTRQGREVFERVLSYNRVSMGGLIFEVGSFMGATLALFREYGFQVCGTDYGSRHIELGRKFTPGIDLRVGGIEALESDGRKADLFLLSHVLEHFLDLEGSLRRLRDLIKPGGYLYLEVPGIYGWTSDVLGGDFLGYLQNAHVYHFSLATLDYVLACSGFERVDGDEYIHALYKMSDRRRSKVDVPQGEVGRVENYLRGLEKRLLPRLVVKRLFVITGLLPLRDRLRGLTS